ncbi:MAG: hypothetical protein KF795_32935 [Labilithrix sp.]|nr:hypothetical protein [Labilithrix sp.]
MSDLDPSSAGSPEGRALDALVGEAKQHLDVREPGARAKRDALADVDWSRLESRVMSAVEASRSTLLRDVERSRAGWRSREGALRAGAIVLAAAAAVVVFVRRDRDAALTDVPSSSSEGASASALRATEGAGEVRVGGIVATPGHVVRAGSAIEVDGARAVFERARKVTWLLEQDDAARTASSGPAAIARARVKSAGESLVLGLEHGVIEADVVPVPAGEAFAVDIATERSLVRVAVHGTHLRVARAGDRVVVDLTEGVISIGTPPRNGVTYGTTVTAPAHVELDATDLSTLRIEHAPAAVRAPVPLRGHESAGPGRVVAAPPFRARAGRLAGARGEGRRTRRPPAREARAAEGRDSAARRDRGGRSRLRRCARPLG